jgi:hypothetical protein
MVAKRRYWNRSGELKMLIEVLRRNRNSRVEVLNNLLMESIQSHANQLHIKRLTKYELEYVWLKLLD